MSFVKRLSNFWYNIQSSLFPMLENDLGKLEAEHKKLAAILEMIRIEEFIPCTKFYMGRPRKYRVQIARAFVAKVVFKLPYTRQIISRLNSDKQLKLICGWDAFNKIPSESMFSRAFQEFSEWGLPEKVHQTLIKTVYEGQIIGHVVKDSVPLKIREKPLTKPNKEIRKKQKNQRRRKGFLNQRQKQLYENNLEKMLAELPTACDKGMKKSAHGYTTIWKGVKLHTAVDDYCVPLAAIITSASVHDSNVAIPLAKKAHAVVSNFYDLMDAAYDHPEIKDYSISLGHIPIIDSCPSNKTEKNDKQDEKKRKKLLRFETALDKRYRQRLPKERFNALYKDYGGGNTIFYRGYEKISCHIMFGVLTLAASTLIGLINR